MQSNVSTVETIMNEIRSGIEDTTLSEATMAAAASSGNLQAELRKAAETTHLLGRCGGSMRGRLCRLFAGPAKPVVEQLDLFHAAVCGALGKLAESCSAQVKTERKVAELEKRLQALEGRMGATRHGDAR